MNFTWDDFNFKNKDNKKDKFESLCHRLFLYKYSLKPSDVTMYSNQPGVEIQPIEILNNSKTVVASYQAKHFDGSIKWSECKSSIEKAIELKNDCIETYENLELIDFYINKDAQLKNKQRDNIEAIAKKAGIDIQWRYGKEILQELNDPNIEPKLSEIAKRFFNSELNQTDSQIIASMQSAEEITSEEILIKFKSANSELRTYPDKIAGQYIEQPKVTSVFDWISNPDDEDKIAVLHDIPGMGKSVFMKHVLKKLESESIPTLVIKADTLKTFERFADFQNEFIRIEIDLYRCFEILLADHNNVVLLIDQLDALSTALSGNTKTLVLLAQFIHQLKELQGCKILVACRSFDLRFDPQIASLEIAREFALSKIDDATIESILKTIDIDFNLLLPATKELLQIPLNLATYVKVIQSQQDTQNEQFSSLQQLYSKLWETYINDGKIDAPPIAKRKEAITKLVSYMYDQESPTLSAPISILDEFTDCKQFLLSIGFIQEQKGKCYFFHQTFFDYCYVRNFFNDPNYSISETILESNQAFKERSIMIQLLAYARELHYEKYLIELRALLKDQSGLTYHLRKHLIDWFLQLQKPQADEIEVGKRLLRSDIELFFNSIKGNDKWFEILFPSDFETLIKQEKYQGVIINYLFSDRVRLNNTDAIIDLLTNYINVNAEWNNILNRFVRFNRVWTRKSIDFYKLLFEKEFLDEEAIGAVDNLSKSEPEETIAIIKEYLIRELKTIEGPYQEEIQRKIKEAEDPNHFSIDSTSHPIGYKLFKNEYILDTLEHLSKNHPILFCETFLIWSIETTKQYLGLIDEQYTSPHYPYDDIFGHHWFSNHSRAEESFLKSLTMACAKYAQQNVKEFRIFSIEMRKSESNAIKTVLSYCFIENVDIYVEDIVQFLYEDDRNLNIGDLIGIQNIWSRLLIKNVFPLLNNDQRGQLENKILNYIPDFEKHPSYKQRGYSQYTLLFEIDEQYLSTDTIRELQQLKRKFSNSNPNQTAFTGPFDIGSPIPETSLSKMSDSDWLSAMRKYNSTSKRTFGIGGVEELSSSYETVVASNPKRFFELATNSFDETISVDYITKTITGILKSEESKEALNWILEIIQQFEKELKSVDRKLICFKLEKRKEKCIPSGLIDYIIDWAKNDPHPLPSQPSGDYYSDGINSTRGSALNCLACLYFNDLENNVGKLFSLFEDVAKSETTSAVRSCVLRFLPFLKKIDEQRAVNIFFETVKNHDVLVYHKISYDVLYYNLRSYFDDFVPFLRTMLASSDSDLNKRGAMLSCLASIMTNSNVAIELADEAITKNEFTKLGAATVFAGNLSQPNYRKTCEKYLQCFLSDYTMEIAKEVSAGFHDFDFTSIENWGFVDAYIESDLLFTDTYHFVKSFVQFAGDYPDRSFRIVERLLEGPSNSELPNTIRSGIYFCETEVVQIPIAIYNSTNNEGLKGRAMRLFEELLKLNIRKANEALEEWDRK